MGKPLVEVLMSTYNGERYLREQIDSILGQEDVDVRLVVRDDGSNDMTLEALSRYRDDPRVMASVGENLGLPRAFFQMIQESNEDADYWALADQDDVWLPGKLSRAVSAIGDAGAAPVLYCARVLVTDSQMRPLYQHPLPRRGPSFSNALVQNIATGSTIVINRAAREALRDRWPDHAVMHDAWLYLVVSGVGHVLYDPAVVVHYRQHAANIVGMGHGPLRRVARRVRRQLAPGRAGAHGRQNADLGRTHVDLLTPMAQLLLADFTSSSVTARRRLAYVIRGAAHRQTAGSSLVMRALYVLGRA